MNTCRKCGRDRGLIDGLCDDCTIEETGTLFPWLKCGFPCARCKLQAKEYWDVRFIDKEGSVAYAYRICEVCAGKLLSWFNYPGMSF